MIDIFYSEHDFINPDFPYFHRGRLKGHGITDA